MFHAKPGDNLEDWERQISMRISAEEPRALPLEIVGPRVLQACKGTAASVVKHLKPNDVVCEDGRKMVIEALKESPFVSELDNQRGEQTQREFMNLRRRAGQSLDNYVAMAQVFRREMMTQSKDLQVGQRFFLRFVRDNAEITEKDEDLVMAAAQDSMTEKAVFPALRRMDPVLQGTVATGKSEDDTQVLRWGADQPACAPRASSAPVLRRQQGGRP